YDAGAAGAQTPLQAQIDAVNRIVDDAVARDDRPVAAKTSGSELAEADVAQVDPIGRLLAEARAVKVQAADLKPADDLIHAIEHHAMALIGLSHCLYATRSPQAVLATEIRDDPEVGIAGHGQPV